MTSTITRWVRRSARPLVTLHRTERFGESTHCRSATREPSSRVLALQNACELLADGFDGFDRHIRTYVSRVPLAKRQSSRVDAEQFLDWLVAEVDLSEEQRDFVEAVRSHQAIGRIAIRQRLAYARFQALVEFNSERLRELDTNRQLTIHLNPTHVWSRFETRALLTEDADVPATVLFYAVGHGVRTVVVSPAAEELLRALEYHGPLRIIDLLRRVDRPTASVVLDALVDLARAGVIAMS